MKLNKRTLFSLLLVLVIVISGCSVKTKSDAQTTETPSNTAETTDQTPVDIELLAQSSSENDVNIIRDQLTKNGFNVKLNLQPDNGSYKSQQDAGNYDIAMSSWTTEPASRSAGMCARSIPACIA